MKFEELKELGSEAAVKVQNYTCTLFCMPCPLFYIVSCVHAWLLLVLYILFFKITKTLYLFSWFLQAAGKYRQEGKTYVVQDGDIIFFKFNVSGGGKKWKLFFEGD